MYLTQGLHRAVQQHPEKIAVRCGDEAMSFRELGERVARLAGSLCALGLQPGDRVAMLSLGSARYIEYQLGVLWAGGVLNPVNIRWSHKEMVHSLQDSGTAILIVDDTFLAMSQGIAREAPAIRHLIHAGAQAAPPGMLSYEALLESATPARDTRRGGDALAGLFYTGGTTGFPKGVMLSHANLAASAMARLATGRFGRNAVYLHALPMFHLGDFGGTCAVNLSGGSHVVLPSFTPQGALEAISRERVTDTTLAPTMIQMIVDWLDAHPCEAHRLDLTSLQLFGYGASPISQALLQRAQRAFPAAGFSQGYGMTEMAPAITSLDPEQHTDEAYASGRMRSVGKPVICVEVRIADESDREVPRGTVGQILARGPNMMLGYWNQPEATAEALCNGWMHTGDGGYMDEDGFIYLVDRLKDMIVSGGENVYSAEVENAISSHPGVAQCAVIGVPSEKWGESVHAVIVPREAMGITAEEVIAHCRELIAGYKVPRSVELREAIPLSPVGKVLKNELRRPYWEGFERRIN
ncbi:long-chain acyl-CoA synthetase [Variovorax boronicumulans]|uniref:long-chain-fatty-acid--CoA ligase n=1 Tax=Variovorax boronicumulans TaxID=436515 RepID=UPI00278410F9|nr:long-chain-fatty-acid--CoA ligase [Variovorax boronicumulans]MDP9917423.1 long-chain acyl-CoA synthetase [Variovorax boronicumulans]